MIIGLDIRQPICGEGYVEPVGHRSVFKNLWAPCAVFYFLCIYFILLPSVAVGQNAQTVRSIRFEGNNFFSSDKIFALLSTKAGGVFSDSVLSSDIVHILTLYKDYAYFQAKVDSVCIKHDTVRHDVDIQIFLNEGKISIFRQIEIDGCRHLKAEEVHAVMQMRVGDPFIPSVLEQDIQAILQQYERKGLPLAKVSVENISFSDSTNEISVNVQLHIDEGRELHVTEMRIEGNKSTKDFVIIREARLKKNEIFYR